MKKASIALIGLLASAQAAPADPPAIPPPACALPENRQFDFWVGTWAVFNTKDGSPAGSSRIESLYAGCAIRENWSEPGLTGGSLNSYVAADHRWHQTWSDSTGAWREFVGGREGASMVLVWSRPSSRFPGRTARRRLVFTPGVDGNVRQQAAETLDGEKWVESYDLTYRRRPDSAEASPAQPQHRSANTSALLM